VRDPETRHGLLCERVARVRIPAFVDTQKADFPIRTPAGSARSQRQGLCLGDAAGRGTLTGRGCPGGHRGAHRAGPSRFTAPLRVAASDRPAGPGGHHGESQGGGAGDGPPGPGRPVQPPEDPHHTPRPGPGPGHPIGRAATSPGRAPMSSGPATPPASGPMRAGATWRPWWTRAHGGCWAEPSPITCARSCAWTPCWPPSRSAVEPAGRDRFHTDHGTQPSTPPGSSVPRAGHWASPSPWASSATATTTRWPE
jgi:hypothetical protein